MANIKVSEMTEATSFDDGDYTMIVQANQSKKIAKENMFSDLKNEITTNATNISNINGEISDINTEISGIIKSGSNANGNYTKFSDGTLMCWGQTGNITSNSRTGVDNNYTLPYAFKDTKYYINTNFLTGGPYFADVSCFAKPKTTSQFQLSTYNNGGGSNTSDFQWFAIGRWK